ncbi:MAG TPA: TlpA disulfide reductase family protein [Candidatus Acidoferrum sp.]|nr:TlpA disulfide reductase family protein [Candidatus Acidoferrum sp.]
MSKLAGLCVILAASSLFFLPQPARAGDPPKSLVTIDSVINDSALLRDKVVYVDFWASWCTPCRLSFPFMNHLLSKYGGKGLTILAVNLDRKSADAEQFLDDMKSNLQVIFDSTGSLAKIYSLDAVPSSFIYGRDGLLRTKHEGFYQKDTLSLDSLVNSLLAETGHK